MGIDKKTAERLRGAGSIVEPGSGATETEWGELQAFVAAIGKTMAIIELSMDGIVLSANTNFLSAMGYTLDEVKGQHHSLFVDENYKRSDEYRAFWASLNTGQFQCAEYKRLGKHGREVWLQACYSPMFDAKGIPYKIVKFATDVTQQKLLAADHAGQIAAIGKSTAVIEFDMDGTIRTANQQFLDAMGYRLDEIKGRHHSIFLNETDRRSDQYREFWQKLNKGEFQQAEYKRLGKAGREVWIQASYNPILDLNGKAFKVVKYATDVTSQKLLAADCLGQISSIGKSQAVIEFEVNGTIRTANDNFLRAMGYTLDEVQGKHHRIFVEEAERNSAEYAEFWAALSSGEYRAAVYKRIGKNGREVWLQASYNPILDPNGKPFKVVKYATEVTEHVKAKLDLQNKVELILDVVRSASHGDLTKEISVHGSDSIGQMGDGLALFFKSLRHSIQQILLNAQSVGEAAQKLIALSSQMAGDAAQTASQAEVVSSSSGEVSKNVSVMATGGDEMLSSIRLIASSSTESVRVTPPGCQRRRSCQEHNFRTRRFQHQDRRCYQSHHFNCSTDESTGFKRHHRSRASRRSRQRLCRCSARSKRTGESDLPRYRRDWTED